MSKNLITLEVEILHETDKAILVETDFGEEVWLPLSQINLCGDEVEIPEWLAEDKGLI